MAGLIFDNVNSDISDVDGNPVTLGGASVAAAGSAEELQFNDGSGGFAASSDLIWDDSAKSLSLSDGTQHLIISTGNPVILGTPNRDVIVIAGSGGFQGGRAYLRLNNSSTAILKGHDALSAAGKGASAVIEGGEAAAASPTGDGGDVILSPGTPNGGSGIDGVVNIDNGDFNIAGTTVITAGLVLDNVTLGATLGATIQAQDDDLDDIAALAPGDGEFITRVGGAWVASGASKNASFGVSTTDATVTEIAALGVGVDEVIVATIRIFGYEAATGDTLSEVNHVTIKNDSGTTALVGTVTNAHTADDAGASAWAVTIAADDGADLLTVDVTGEAAHSIDWTCVIEWTQG